MADPTNSSSPTPDNAPADSLAPASSTPPAKPKIKVRAKPVGPASAQPAVTAEPTDTPPVTRPKTVGDKKDLSQLDLATGVDRIPELWNRHGNKILLVFTLIAVAYAVYSYRQRAVTTARATTELDLSVARDTLTDLRSSPLAVYPDQFYASKRKQALEDAGFALNEILEQTTSDDYRVQALILRGDLFYTLALLPDRAAATTQPSLQLGQTPDQLFTTAEQAYNTLISQFPARTTEIAHARLGLAAIAENKGDFTAATDQYNKLIADESISPIYRDVARRRLTMIPDLTRPMRLRGTEAAIPTTLPSAAPTPTPAPSTLP